MALLAPSVSSSEAGLMAAARVLRMKPATRGAAIAIYAATSIAPLLLIVVAIAGLVFGHDVALTAITDQLSGLMGKETATFLNTAVSNASKPSSGILAAAIGVITLIADWLRQCLAKCTA